MFFCLSDTLKRKNTCKEIIVECVSSALFEAQISNIFGKISKFFDQTDSIWINFIIFVHKYETINMINENLNLIY